MEKYEEIKKLGKGAQASCYLVKHKAEGKEYVLKKIECDDEGAARKAFQEAMALNELRHQSVCGYKEFFVFWDKKTSAMYVCIIMENYPKGDLSRILTNRRGKKQLIELPILQKWTGQMLSGLAYIHAKNIIHRDLKPSNIFLRNDLTLAIGDFGVATLMDDKRTKTRTTVGSVNWMAPEVFERPYDDRSDIWSFGCILLEMVTCSILDQKEVRELLFEIKKEDNSLTKVLAKDLCKSPFGAAALKSSGISSSATSDKTETNAKIPAPKADLNLKDSMAYLEKYYKSSSAATAILPRISFFTKSEKLTQYSRPLLLTMLSHKENDAIVIQCLKLLQFGCVTSELLRPLYSIVRTSKCKDVVNESMIILSQLNSEKSIATIGSLGFIHEICLFIKKYKSEKEVFKNCVKALWSACVNESNAELASQENVLPDVFDGASKFKSDALVTAEVVSLYWALSLEDACEKQILESAVPGIFLALQLHKKDVKVVRACFMALTSIASCGEAACAKILNPSSTEKKVNGLMVFVTVVKEQASDKQGMEEFVLLIDEMIQEKSIKEQMKKCSALKAELKKIQTYHKNIEKLSEIIAAL
ncbi:Oidioi.mRNA.OKI2018_I69.chr2.g7687.t1.cds [Oikopleura dioica]|uniref:non-specific serine/threonine protein kinase n=1 Tax=Oikopleura dioica TaxID=34765 RepID=A0ABN7TAF7_OIKDI|nr:Oidioi.mRNA.OKI2018_I69.chr2.g7687.t1.cds [Oikopleura dioica]